MSDEVDIPVRALSNQGHRVPIVAFYSIQGGVGKTTLSRKFAELVTVAPGRDGRRPNVLLIDLDVGAQGLTFRLAHGLRQNFRSVHDVMAERSVTAAQPIPVSGSVSLSNTNAKGRGQLYLLPAAPPEAKGLFDTIAEIDKKELVQLLYGTISAIVKQCDISCVVIDCAPGADPYTAAAASIADVPLLIGRNEAATYEQIRILPERFREWYPEFQPAKQRVIINAVSVQTLYQTRAQEYAVFDYIPLTSAVIHETEGLSGTGTLQMLLLEKYIVDIIKQVLIGQVFLIPEAPEVLGPEWMSMLGKLSRCSKSRQAIRLRQVGRLRWVGLALVVIGATALMLQQQLLTVVPSTGTFGWLLIVVGSVLIAAGWYAVGERQRLLEQAKELLDGGSDQLFEKLKLGASHRSQLDKFRKIAETIPEEQDK